MRNDFWLKLAARFYQVPEENIESRTIEAVKRAGHMHIWRADPEEIQRVLIIGAPGGATLTVKVKR